MKYHVDKRLTYLYTGETVAIFMFIGLSYMWNQTFPTYQLYSLYSFWGSFSVFLFILVQGSVYWYSKQKQLRNFHSMKVPYSVLRGLQLCKTTNMICILFIPLLFILDGILFWSDIPTSGLAVSLFFYLFAIAEHINYYYIQLSYDNRSDIDYLLKQKKLKRSQLYRELKDM
ncbi:general stress protein [Bacillus sp. BGMRC 2118]|nr:general stress protein [Bacillus sp. BGMRC 2118]